MWTTSLPEKAQDENDLRRHLIDVWLGVEESVIDSAINLAKISYLYTRKRLIQVYRDDILASDHPSDGSSVIKTTLLNMFTCTPMLGAKFYES